MYPKIPIIRNKDYTVELEPHAGALWTHCTVLSFSKSIFKSLVKDCEDYLSTFKQDLYVLRDPIKDTPKAHFIKAFGFTFNRLIQDKNNIPYEIWKRNT